MQLRNKFTKICNHSEESLKFFVICRIGHVNDTLYMFIGILQVGMSMTHCICSLVFYKFNAFRYIMIMRCKFMSNLHIHVTQQGQQWRSFKTSNFGTRISKHSPSSHNSHRSMVQGASVPMRPSPKGWKLFLKPWYVQWHSRADSRIAPSKWETSLQSKAVSHWLGANLESAQTQLWLTGSHQYKMVSANSDVY